MRSARFRCRAADALWTVSLSKECLQIMFLVWFCKPLIASVVSFFLQKLIYRMVKAHLSHGESSSIARRPLRFRETEVKLFYNLLFAMRFCRQRIPIWTMRYDTRLDALRQLICRRSFLRIAANPKSLFACDAQMSRYFVIFADVTFDNCVPDRFQ